MSAYVASRFGAAKPMGSLPSRNARIYSRLISHWKTLPWPNRELSMRAIRCCCTIAAQLVDDERRARHLGAFSEGGFSSP